MSLEPRTSNAREESIRRIAHALRAKDQDAVSELPFMGQNRYTVKVEFQSEDQYLADAERILDAEIVRMAQERVMERIRGM